MFSRSHCGLWLFGVLLLVLPLAGCQRGAEQFTKLDADESGFLVPDEIDANRDGTISGEELDYKNTTTRRVEHFFADGSSTADKQLSPAEFDQALLGNRMPGWMIAIIVVLVVGIPVPLGLQLGNYLRMPDHGWKIALVLLTVTAAIAITYFGWPPKRGIDLSGGVILIYEIDVAATRQQGVAGDGSDGNLAGSEDEIKINDVVAALRKRINPGGVKEIVIRPYGSEQVEIIVPEVEAVEVDYIKDLVSKTGQLEFLIVANPFDPRHTELIAKARSSELLPLRETNVAQAGDFKGRWVPLGVEERQRDDEPDYHGAGLGDVLRAKQRGSDGFVEVRVPNAMMKQIEDKNRNFKQVLDELGYDDLQVLMLVNPLDRFNIKGQHMLRASSSFDPSTMDPAVIFTMKPTGASLLERLTSDNLPDTAKERYNRMGIIMDGELISAPRLLSTIGREGQITGNFTQQEVDFLVSILRAGRLPAVLRKEPISENQVSALLGDDTIRQGAIAIISSLVITLVFMLYYYRFAGLVACMALLLNLLFTVALMISIRAAFTLPGIAGLVLGVGMSVDANILIFERIREEMERGAGLRMALRNGFSRAATTIIDSNMTTMITAIVLYGIGTEQIRGFAITLILGLVISMFTAIFCARVVFDVAERQRWITRLKMVQWITRTNFDFIGKQRWAIGGSLLIMVIGLGAVVARGGKILDIDFAGGTSVELLFKEPQPIDQVRALVLESKLLGDTDPSVTLVRVEGYDDGRVYKIDSSITGDEAPVVGDPAMYDPSGGTNTSPVTVAAVNAEKRTADLVAADGTTKFANVSWDNFQRDGVRIVQDALINIFKDKLEQRSLTIESVAALDVGPAVTPPAVDNGGGEAPSDDDLMPDSTPDNSTEETPPTDPPATPDNPATDPPAEDPPATETPPAEEPAPSESGDTPPADEAPADEGPSATPDDDDGSAIFAQPYVFTALQDETTPAGEAETPPATEETAEPADDEPSTPETTPDVGTVDETTSSAPEVVLVREGRTEAQLKFGHPVNAPTVTAAVKKAVVDTLGLLDLSGVRLSNKDWDGSAGQRFNTWTVDLPLDQATSQRVLDAMQKELQGQPVWLSSSKIGPQIAGNLREVALAALIFATLGIIGYIWFRFHRAVFGVAAVIAMVHDVLITLGAIGLSYYLSQFLGFLGIDEFKINMTLVAALLTVIGYSLNDTVVVFDRIREVRGKNPDLTVAMVNQSVNQTLSRTLLTSFTTILSLLAMYIIGGPSIRGFAFTLLVGIVVGTFSSIYIASPCLLWLMKVTKQAPNRPEKPAKTPDLTNV